MMLKFSAFVGLIFFALLTLFCGVVVLAAVCIGKLSGGVSPELKPTAAPVAPRAAGSFGPKAEG